MCVLQIFSLHFILLISSVSSDEQNILIFFYFIFAFIGLYPRHMEVPRLGAELELQLPAYTTATATQNTSPFLAALNKLALRR